MELIRQSMTRVLCSWFCGTLYVLGALTWINGCAYGSIGGTVLGITIIVIGASISLYLHTKGHAHA